MSRDEFAEFMKVNPRTVDTWIRRGRITSKVLIKGRNYFKVSDCLEEMGLSVEEWLSMRDSV